MNQMSAESFECVFKTICKSFRNVINKIAMKFSENIHIDLYIQIGFWVKKKVSESFGTVKLIIFNFESRSEWGVNLNVI